MLTPDITLAQRFLDLLGPGEQFTFQAFPDREEDKQTKPHLRRILHGTLEQHAPALIRLNQEGAGIFTMVNRGDGIVRDGSKTCRTNANVIAIRAVFADVDGVPVQPILEQAPPPHIIVESSPGKWHLYWRTSDTPLEEFSARQLAIAKRFGTDPAVKDLARVMRVPGFFHQKAEPFMTRLIENMPA